MRLSRCREKASCRQQIIHTLADDSQIFFCHVVVHSYANSSQFLHNLFKDNFAIDVKSYQADASTPRIGSREEKKGITDFPAFFGSPDVVSNVLKTTSAKMHEMFVVLIGQ